MGSMTSMDVMAIFSTIVLLATVATSIFAVAAYVVSRGYTKRRTRTRVAPAIPPPTPGEKPVLKRYNPYNVNA